jgi:hypothetical protein
MKQLNYYVALLFIAMLPTSCGNDSKKGNTEIENTSETVKKVAKVIDEAPAMQENVAQLRNKTPLTKAQFESWLPDTLLDMPRTFSQINFMPGLSSCGANYTLGNKKIKIMVIDGAGEKGAGAVGTYKLYSKMDYDTKDENRYKKSRVIDGVKVVEAYRKSGNTYSLSMFYDERFGVHIEIFELEQHALDKVFKELKLNELNNLN